MKVSASESAGSPFRVATPAFLFFLLVLAAYWDPVFLKRNFAGRDLLAYNLPMEYAVHDAYARGRLPVWSAEISGGRPLAPNPNVGALYPVRMLLSPLPFPFAMRWFPVLHWALAGIGMILLLDTFGVSLAAGWVGAVTFAFSGVAVSEVYFPHIQPGLSLLPWILWAMRGPKRASRRVLSLAVLFGLDMLAADVFTIGAALLCTLLWIGLEVEPPRRGSAAIELGCAFFLGGLIAAPQIVATSLWIPETKRAVIGVKVGEALQYTVSPFRLVEFLVPYPFGPTWSLDYASVWAKSVFRGRSIGLFASLYSGSFALIAALRMAKDRRPGSRGAFAVLLTAALLCVAPSLVPSKIFSVRAPVALRNPEKFAVLFVFALAILAGLGFDRFRSKNLGRLASLGVGGALAIAALVCQMSPEWAGRFAVRVVGSDPAWSGLASLALPGALAEAGILWMGMVLAIGLVRAGGAPRVVVGVLLITAAAVAVNGRSAQTYREDEVFAPTAFARTIRRLDPSGSYRALGESLYLPTSDIWNAIGGGEIVLNLERRSWAEQTQALWKYGTVLNDDFDAGDLSRVESLRRLSFALGRFQNPAGLFRSLSLKWGVRFRDQPPLPGFRRMGGDGSQDWDELGGALPDIRALDRWVEENDARKIPKMILGRSSDLVVVESDVEKTGDARPARVRIFEKSPERLAIETDGPDPTWLFVLRGFWSYREVRVDGRLTDVVPAQVGFSAVPIPAGRHRIQWREILPGGSVSVWGPVLFLVSAFVILIVAANRHRAANRR